MEEDCSSLYISVPYYLNGSNITLTCAPTQLYSSCTDSGVLQPRGTAVPGFSFDGQSSTAVTPSRALWHLVVCVPMNPQPTASQVAQAHPHVICLGDPDSLQTSNESSFRRHVDQVPILITTMFHRLLPCIVFLHQNKAALKTVELKFVLVTVHGFIGIFVETNPGATKMFVPCFRELFILH